MNDTVHRGLRIQKVISGKAQSAGVQEGDLLIALDGYALNSFQDYADAKEKAGEQYTLTILRGQQLLELTLERSDERR